MLAIHKLPHRMFLLEKKLYIKPAILNVLLCNKKGVTEKRT